MVENRENINNLVNELSQLIGQPINDLHMSVFGRYHYIQAPKAGAPMLLHHYRGPMFVDIHPNDYSSLIKGEISAHDYVSSARWQVGYYWGGGSMIGGGYYQPIDIIHRQDEVRRYLKILSCRGKFQSCGYMPTEKQCADCSVENCPLRGDGNWNAEMPENDSRINLLEALRERFEQENPGYTLRGFSCKEIPNGEIWLIANRHCGENSKYSFRAFASDSVIRSLLMHEIEPKNWENYAKSFRFLLQRGNQAVNIDKKMLEKACKEMEYRKRSNPVRAFLKKLF